MIINFDKVGAYTLTTIGILTLLSAVGTFFGTLDPLLQEWGMEQYTILFGVMKLIGAALLLWNKTRLLGALFLASYFGGAIATHVAFDSFPAQFVILIVITVSIYVGALSKVFGDKGSM